MRLKAVRVCDETRMGLALNPPIQTPTPVRVASVDHDVRTHADRLVVAVDDRREALFFATLESRPSARCCCRTEPRGAPRLFEDGAEGTRQNLLVHAFTTSIGVSRCNVPVQTVANGEKVRS